MENSNLTPSLFDAKGESELHYVFMPSARLEPEIKQGSTLVLKFIDESELKVGKMYLIDYSRDEHRLAGVLKSIDGENLTLGYPAYDPEKIPNRYYEPNELKIKHINGCFAIVGSITHEEPVFVGNFG